MDGRQGGPSVWLEQQAAPKQGRIEEGQHASEVNVWALGDEEQVGGR